jgi:hypothetical protein
MASTWTYAALTTAIGSYCEVDTNVFTATISDGFIQDTESRILYDLPMDSDRKSATGNFALDDNTINAPAGCLFVRGVEVFDSTSVVTGNSVFLQKKDQTYLREYVAKLTGPAGGLTGQDVTGQPKYYAMFGGATGLTDSTSGGLLLAPTPDTTYAFRIYYNSKPTSLVTDTSGTYLSRNFANGLLYGCLAEAFGYLKGPMDMLTLYENKYKQEVQKFAGAQLGRRRRDDYTDGTIRIPVKSPSP